MYRRKKNIMRDLSILPGVALVGYIGMLVVIVGLLIAGHLFIKRSNAFDRVFGGFLYVIAMFVSGMAFLIGLIASTPAVTPEVSTVGLMNIVTEVVMWSSLIPFVFVPAFLIYLMGKEYQNVLFSSPKSQSGALFSGLDRLKAAVNKAQARKV